jgi:hypothetical protein
MGRPRAAVVARGARELGGQVETGDRGVRLVARVITGDVWLLLGMLGHGAWVSGHSRQFSMAARRHVLLCSSHLRSIKSRTTS